MANTIELLTYENDVLLYMNTFTLLKVQSRAVTFYCVLITVYALVTCSVGFWIMITYYPSESLTDYICQGAVKLMGLTVIMIFPYLHKAMRHLVEESHSKFRAAHSEGEEGYRQILVEVNNIKKFHGFTMLFLLVLDLYSLCNAKVRSSFIFFVISDRGFCGEFCWLMEIANYVTLQTLWLPIYWFLSVHLYGTRELMLQVMLLKMHITRSLKFTKNISIDDAVMQEKCKKCLEGVVKFHIDIISLIYKITNIMGRMGIILFAPAILLVIAAVYGTFMSHTIEVKIFLVLFLLFSAWEAYVVGSAGQIVTDESDGLLFCFYDCAWFNWNKSNCKILVIAMSNVMKPMKITFFQLFDIDLTIIVQVCRLTYAAVTCLLNLSGNLLTSIIESDQ